MRFPTASRTAPARNAASSTARSTARTLPALALAAALVAGVAGCTAVGPGAGASTTAAAPAPASTSASGASGQTKQTACQILGSSLQSLSTNLQTAYDKYSSDPKAAVAALQSVSNQFQASISKVSEPGAQALANKAQADLKTLIADTQDAVAHPITGAAKVAKLVPTLKDDITKIGTYCG